MDIHASFPTDNNSHWGVRTPLVVDIPSGIMTAGTATRPINIHGSIDYALSSYLSMVYELRSLVSGVIPLRQEDILSLANVFQIEELHVTERLARLMHCDDLQTQRLIQMVKKGRVLVPVSMVAAGALLAATLSFSSPTSPSQTDNHANLTSISSNTISANVSQDTDLPATNNSDTLSSTQSDEHSNVENSQQVSPLPKEGEVQIGDAIVVSRDDNDN